MKLSGEEFIVFLDQWKELPPEVGCYAGASKFIRSQRECPYCHGHMSKAQPTDDGGIWRIARVVSRHKTSWRVIGQLIPQSHTVFACRHCKQAFTLPSDGPKES